MVSLVVKGKFGKTSKSQNIMKLIVGTKFHLKQSILNFGTYFLKKNISSLKQKK